MNMSMHTSTQSMHLSVRMPQHKNAYPHVKHMPMKVPMHENIHESGGVYVYKTCLYACTLRAVQLDGTATPWSSTHVVNVYWFAGHHADSCLHLIEICVAVDGLQASCRLVAAG